MTQSIPSRQGSGKLAIHVAPMDEASNAFVTALPILVVDLADLPKTARRLASLFAVAGHLFERDSRAVRVASSADGEQVEPLNVQHVILEAHDVCRPVLEHFNGSEFRYEPVTLPTQVAKLYLNLGEQRNLSPLKGICSAPMLTGAGQINCSRGYDKASGLWCSGLENPAIPHHPSLADAREALGLMRVTFASFPFEDAARMRSNEGAMVDLSTSPGADESGFLVGLLTAVCRPSLALAPALLIRAPQLSGSGTGKGLLARAISEIAYGRTPRAFTSRGGREELTKRIESALMGSAPLIFIDNCNVEQLRSNVLAQALTEGAVDTRPLGRSRMVPLNNSSFFVVTGNAVQITEDLVRRFLVVNLDAKCENPELRSFDQNFEHINGERRLRLLEAALTVWRWGRQNNLAKGLPLGSFEQWASWCRDPLIALGCVDPVRRIAEMKAQDPQRQRISNIFQAWFACHGAIPVRFGELNPHVSCLFQGNRQTRVMKLQELNNARADGFVFEVVKPKGRWSAQKYMVRREDA
jgi:hypothetical protein